MNAKTAKMLETALKAASGGGSVIIIVPHHHDVRPAALALSSRDYGGVWDGRISKYRTNKGGTIFIMPMKNEAVSLKTMYVRGYAEEAVFWDPAVLETTFARVLKEYHRYD